MKGIHLLGLGLLAALTFVAPWSRAQAQVIDVELEPPAIQVAQGGCFDFTVSITNTTGERQAFLLGAMITLPSGRTIELRSPRPMVLGPNQSVRLNPMLCTPRRAPLGNYTLTVTASDRNGNPIDSDSMTVTVVAPVGVPSGGDAWDLRNF